MEFLAPLMLIGLAGASVPVIIHLIGRRRAPVVRFGAMDFLLGQNKRVARRLRLRQNRNPRLSQQDGRAGGKVAGPRGRHTRRHQGQGTAQEHHYSSSSHAGPPLWRIHD